MINAALVLEGGSLRTVYSSGVLDVFMENDLEFAGIVGVSAGALNAGNYMAHEIGRSAKINILHSDDPHYFGIWRLITTRSIFNYDYLFYSPMKDTYPYNEQALMNSTKRLFVGATELSSGKIKYFERQNYDDLVHVLQASSSIPLLSKPVNINGELYLDGAIADPIGLLKAKAEGYDKIVVVSTRPEGYKKQFVSWFIRTLYGIFYRKYPALRTALNNAPQAYNDIQNKINQLESNGQIFVIKPSRNIKIKHLERDARKLTDLYLLGRDDTLKALPRLREYIKM